MTVGRRAFRWGWRLLLFVLLVLLGVQLWFFAHIAYWRFQNPGETAFMEHELARLRAKDPKATLRQQWVPYERISNNLKRAVIAAEDARFNEHEGVDWQAVEKAYEENMRRGRPVKGGSTISQQLAKNLFLSPDRSYLRKAEELIITGMLEFAWDKRRILEVYLNVVEWGDGVFGAEAAARHYYGRSAAKLAPDSAAWLAAIVPNPRLYDRNRNTPFIQRKSATILARMPAAELP
jgi:monofunctional glycosyltransferase